MDHGQGSVGWLLSNGINYDLIQRTPTRILKELYRVGLRVQHTQRKSELNPQTKTSRKQAEKPHSCKKKPGPFLTEKEGRLRRQSPGPAEAPSWGGGHSQGVTTHTGRSALCARRGSEPLQTSNCYRYPVSLLPFWMKGTCQFCPASALGRCARGPRA